MPIIDDRGRVFGRLNLVDAALLLFVIVLVPAAYGAYLLLRDPPATLRAVNPNVIEQAPSLQVEVRGEHLRPYMRVSFNDEQGRAFWFVNPTTAVVPLPDLRPGTYDVVLYDYMREVARLRAAVRIEPAPAPPMVQVEVNGAFTSLTDEQARSIHTGLRLVEADGSTAEVISVGTPEPDLVRIATGDTSVIAVPVKNRVQLPVRIRASCVVSAMPDGTLRCTAGGTALARDSNVRYPALNTALILHITDVRPPDAAAK
jgi:hypothetical protein